MSNIPNIAHPITDPQGRVTTPWYQYLATLATAGSGGGVAPGNGEYLVGAPDSGLPNARVATDSATVDVDLSVPNVIRWHVDSAGTSWVPLSLGVEPLQFVSDGAGSPIFVSFTP